MRKIFCGKPSVKCIRSLERATDWTLVFSKFYSLVTERSLDER